MRAAESADIRMVMRVMLRCGLRVSEAVAMRPSWLRLDQEPPVLRVPADIVGNKSKLEREVPIPADLVEFLRDRASGKVRVRNDRLFSLTRQAVGQGVKRAAEEAGMDPARAHPHAFRHTYGRHAILSGVPVNVLQLWMGHTTPKMTMLYVQLAGDYHSYVDRI